ncbi:MAG TPA: GGDEF domain-containing protein, partial [Longimicrobiales bacterium]|nr:GGDEF domain-containing protein [Longimicrobiales bacterium]
MPYWILPGALVLLCTGLWTTLAPRSALLAELARGYPFLLLAGAALLAWRFQKSRLAVAALLLALAGGALMAWPPHQARILRDGLAVLLPLALGTLALTDDRGVTSRGGLTQLAVFVALPALLVALLAAAPWEAARLLASYPLGPVPAGALGLPTAALVACVLGAALSVGASAVRRRAADAGLLWALAASLLFLLATPGGPVQGAWLLAGALALLVAVVEASYAMAYHDELTGLPARRALSRALAQLTPPYAVAVVDIDHFKQVNDRHGHDVGDQVLRMVATRLARGAGTGRTFRSGGEEFTVLFAGGDRPTALTQAEVARAAVEAEPFRLRGPGRPRRTP